MAWATGCHIICPGSPLKHTRWCPCPEVAEASAWWCQELPRDAEFFLPVMCWVFCIYVLSYGLPNYMSGQFAEAAQRLPKPVPGGAEHCQEMLSFFSCDVLSFLFICPELWVAKWFVWAVYWGCPEVVEASAWWCQALPRDAEFFCLWWCAEFFAYMSWAMGFHIICPGSSLRLPRSCGSQCLVVPGIAKRCWVFLPVMCRVLWIYVLSSQLPHYMSRQWTEASWWVPRPVPGGARHCQEIQKCHSKCRIEWPVFASAPVGALSHVSQ